MAIQNSINNTLGDALTLTEISEPSTPDANQLKLYAGDRASRVLLRTKGPSGIDTPIQPALFANSQLIYTPGSPATAALGPTYGGTFTLAGSIPTTAVLASTNMQTSMRRTQFNSTTNNNAAAGLFTPYTACWLGNAAGLGGFFFQIRFSTLTNQANNRAFIGLHSSITSLLATNANPSAIAGSHIGICIDTGDSGWFITTRNGTTTTRVAIAPASGSEFISTMSKSTTEIYDFYMFAPPNSTSVTFYIKSVTSDTVIVDNYNTSTTLPANTTFLGIQSQIQAGTSGVIQSLLVNKIYLETDL